MKRYSIALLTGVLWVTASSALADSSWWPTWGSKPALTKAKRGRAVEAFKDDDFLASFGTGLPIVSGDLAWGFDIDGVYRVSNDVPIFVGLDFGYYHLSKTYLAGDVGLNVVRFGPTAIYRHPVSRKVYLYGGVAIGPAFGSPNYDVIKLASATKLYVMLRPGAEFALNELFSISTEIRMGIAPDLSINVDRVARQIVGVSAVGSGFIIYPQVNGVFRF